MNEREAFLHAIAANPADDTVRLAFADWLDEHDESGRAEFIRLQINREQSGGKADSTAMSSRETELLKQHKTEWLGPLPALETYQGFAYTFRRGFVESAEIHGRLLTEHAEALRTSCPAMTDLDVIGVRGFGEHIAKGLPASLRTLRLEDWPFPDDAKAIASSPLAPYLETLSFWVGSKNDESVCREFVVAQTLPTLQRLELVQLDGGIDAFEYVTERDAHADRLAELINTQKNRPLAIVHRPCSDLYPLAPHVGRYKHGGHLPDGRQVLIYAQGDTTRCVCYLHYFDRAGHLVSGECIEVMELQKKPKYGGYDEEELFTIMNRRIGFVPGMIRVHEFDAEGIVPNCWTRLYRFPGNAREFIESPDTDPEWFEDRESEIEFVRAFLRDGSFCINHGGDDVWLGQDGKIHST